MEWLYAPQNGELTVAGSRQARGAVSDRQMLSRRPESIPSPSSGTITRKGPLVGSSTVTTSASPDWPYWGTRRQRPYRLELGNDELIVREADGTEYAVPLGRISRIRIGVFAEEGWRAELARTSRLYPSLRFWIGDAPVGMRLYAYGDDPGFRTFMRALAAAVLRDHRFTTLETGEDDIRTYGTALVGLLCAIAVPVLFAQGITSGDASRLAGSAMCGAVAAMAYIEAFRRWPRRAGTMKVVDAALLTQHVPSE